MLSFSALLAMIYSVSSISYRMVLIMINHKMIDDRNQLFWYLTFWYLIMLMVPHHSSWINVLCLFHTCLRLSDLPKVMQLSSSKFRVMFFNFHITIGIRAFICLLAKQVRDYPIVRVCRDLTFTIAIKVY